jgi:hypothetical protein
MRKSMFPLILLFFVHIYGFANSQNVADKKITIQVSNLELKKVFNTPSFLIMTSGSSSG